MMMRRGYSDWASAIQLEVPEKRRPNKFLVL
jgi:hypothetical protein